MTEKPTPPPDPFYTACLLCSAKFLSHKPPDYCPRCCGPLLPPVRAPRPWTFLKDRPAPPGRKTGLVCPRRGALYGLRGALRAKADEEMMLSPPTLQVIETLARHTRVLTVGQVAEAFYSNRKDPMDCARRAVRTLCRRGLAEAWHTSLGTAPAPAPLWRGVPNQSSFSGPHVSWLNEQRWRSVHPVRATCVQATARALDGFGGSCRPSRPTELEHDVAVAAVYLRLRAAGITNAWRHEDACPHQAGPRADAAYRRGSELVIVEVLGRGYDHEKVSAIWRAHADRTLEMW